MFNKDSIVYSFSDHVREITSNAKKVAQYRRRQQLLSRSYNIGDPRASQLLDSLDLLNELETLLDIVAKTKDFTHTPRSEALWNEHIHACILDLALAYHPAVKVENMTRASVAKPFHPLARPELELESPLPTKTVDYALVLDPPDELGRSIRDFVGKLEMQSFNQSNYDPLLIAPSGVFIETKIDSERYPEAKAQLGIWLATWFDRVSEFRPTSDLVIPVLIANGKEWEVWFAMDRHDHFDVCGPLAIGGTDTLRSIYLLRYCLSCLGDWMSVDFRRWVELCVKP